MSYCANAINAQGSHIQELLRKLSGGFGGHEKDRDKEKLSNRTLLQFSLISLKPADMRS